MNNRWLSMVFGDIHVGEVRKYVDYVAQWHAMIVQLVGIDIDKEKFHEIIRI